MNKRNFGKKSLIGLSLLTAVLCAGCEIESKQVERPTDTATSNGMHKKQVERGYTKGRWLTESQKKQLTPNVELTGAAPRNAETE